MEVNISTFKKVAIIGFGKEGISTLEFLRKKGIPDKNITILDKNSDLEIKNFNGRVILGDGYLNNLDEYDHIFRSPGVSPYSNGLLRYKEKVLTQTKLFFEFYKGKVISITQTKGKSTTATLCYQVLKNAGYNVKLVGNIGNPVLDEIDLGKDNYDFIVYELSSYMLEGLENHHSYISIFGNIYKDHLDWHLGFENYLNAKKNVLKNAKNILIGLNLYPKIKKDLLSRNFLTFGPLGAYYSHDKNEYFINGKRTGIILNPKIPGNHNLDNFAGVLGVCDIVGISNETFVNTINNFPGLPHRLENLGTYHGITFIDDAISTTPESTIEAVKTYSQSIGTIFLGGTDRGYDFKGLVQILEENGVRNLVLFPDTSSKIRQLVEGKGFNVFETESMKDAVSFAFKNTPRGKICLLSTASPSYRLWKNFEEKGNQFKDEIIKYVSLNPE